MNAPFKSDSDQISLVPIANAILRRWRMFVILPVMFAAFVGATSLMGSRSYAATASFVSQAADGRQVSGAAALARQVGILSADRPGESPQFYAALITGRTILRQAVESEYLVTDDVGRTRRATLIDVFEIEPGRDLPEWRYAVETLRGMILVSVARETGVVEITVSNGDPALAEQIAERLVELLNEFNLNTRQSRAREETRFVQARLSEAQHELIEAEGQLQSFLRQNRTFSGAPELVFEHDRLQRQVTMRQGLYSSLAEAYEQARIDAVRDVPVITVIDAPVGSARPLPRGTVRRTVLAFLLGILIATAVAIGADMMARTRRRDVGAYDEFHRLKKEAWEDVREPKRWFGGRRRPIAAGDA